MPRARTRMTMPCHQVRTCGSAPVPPAPSGEIVTGPTVVCGAPLAVCHGALGLRQDVQYWVVAMVLLLRGQGEVGEAGPGRGDPERPRDGVVGRRPEVQG